jgi:hopanoid biosynthesis associated RND transporter like protein HpnN
VISTHPGIAALLGLAVGVLGTLQLPWLAFDSNVIKIRDQRTESVQAFNDLLADSGTSPWSANAMAPSLAAAERKAGQFGALDAVGLTVTLADYVPSDQDEKIEILADAAMMLDTPRAATGGKAVIPVNEQIDALRRLHAALDAGWLREARAPLATSARALRDELGRFLERVQTEDDPARALADLERLLLGNFREQLERLQQALEPPPVTLESLPTGLAKRMLVRDGPARIQIFPSEDLSDTAQMYRFVDAVRTVDPDTTGVAVNLVELARATGRSLRQALLTAFLAIAVLLFLLWRRVVDMLLVLLPLFLALVSTGAFMVLIDMPFNFVNVVVLPLLLGIGVDSGIHLVHRSHTMRPGDVLLATTTARAVFFSAVTTIASFGSLAFSAHQGVASMGTLLVCGMILTLISNLVILPALIALRMRWLGTAG